MLNEPPAKGPRKRQRTTNPPSKKRMNPAPDDQWPRYQVFHQQRPDRPHVNAGSVHAPDSELALQNARDVFVRRPECSGLWVARADHISSMTREQFERHGSPDPANEIDAPEPYLVFEKRAHIGSHEHQGEVQARSAAEALGLAAERDPEQPALVWWVVPKRLVASSEQDQSDSWFEPARSKDFRGQTAFPTTTMMRKLRQQTGE